MKPQSKDQREREIAKRADAGLAALLKMPPKPHKKMKAKKKPPKKPDHISQEDWDAVDSPPLTDEMLANLKPTSEAHPEIVERHKRARKKKPSK